MQLTALTVAPVRPESRPSTHWRRSRLAAQNIVRATSLEKEEAFCRLTHEEECCGAAGRAGNASTCCRCAIMLPFSETRSSHLTRLNVVKRIRLSLQILKPPMLLMTRPVCSTVMKSLLHKLPGRPGALQLWPVIAVLWQSCVTSRQEPSDQDPPARFVLVSFFQMISTHQLPTLGIVPCQV